MGERLGGHWASPAGAGQTDLNHTIHHIDKLDVPAVAPDGYPDVH
jgi:hypothetical protein